MNKTRRFPSILVGMVSTLVLLAAAPAAKAVTLPLNNANFDATGEETNGTGFSTSIGWSDANPNNPSGGIYSNSPAQSLPNAAYTTPGTFNGGYQLSDYVLQTGDQITLTYYAQVGWQSSNASVHLIDTTKTYTGGGYGQCNRSRPLLRNCDSRLVHSGDYRYLDAIHSDLHGRGGRCWQDPRGRV